MSSFLVRNGAQSDFGKLLVLQQNLWNSSTVECTFRAYNNVGTSLKCEKREETDCGNHYFRSAFNNSITGSLPNWLSQGKLTGLYEFIIVLRAHRLPGVIAGI